MFKFIILIKLFLFNYMTYGSDLYKFNFEHINGNVLSMEEYRQKPILIVNTASMCGFTKQYDGLQTLYEKYKDKGLVIIGMPSNSFMQEFTKEEKIKDFCETRFNITFPMTKILNVTGDEKHIFYSWLDDNYGVKPKWNFYKFLFNKKGEFVDSFSSLQI